MRTCVTCWRGLVLVSHDALSVQIQMTCFMSVEIEPGCWGRGGGVLGGGGISSKRLI